MADYVSIVLAVLAVAESCFGLMGELDYDGRLNIRLEHSFDNSINPEFTHRGEIAIKSLQTEATYIEQAKLTSAQVKSLLHLSKIGGNYRLRATVVNSDGTANSFLTFVKACALVESQLSDLISVHLDHLGNVISISLSTSSTCSGDSTDPDSLGHLNTSVAVRHMEIGPVPDTASYVQKLEREREAKERGETKDNRSFLGKYWMYIVPVVIFILLSSATNPEGAGGQR